MELTGVVELGTETMELTGIELGTENYGTDWYC